MKPQNIAQLKVILHRMCRENLRDETIRNLSKAFSNRRLHEYKHKADISNTGIIKQLHGVRVSVNIS